MAQNSKKVQVTFTFETFNWLRHFLEANHTVMFKETSIFNDIKEEMNESVKVIKEDG